MVGVTIVVVARTRRDGGWLGPWQIKNRLRKGDDQINTLTRTTSISQHLKLRLKAETDLEYTGMHIKLFNSPYQSLLRKPGIHVSYYNLISTLNSQSIQYCDQSFITTQPVNFPSSTEI
jgi:hypothetical protein